MNSLVDIVFNLIVNTASLLIFMRFMMQLAAVDRFNPAVMSTIRATKVVDEFERILPSIYHGRLSLAAILILVLLRLVGLSGNYWMEHGFSLEPVTLVVLTVFSLTLDFFIYSRYIIFGAFILSWVMMLSSVRSPFFEIIMQIAEMFCAPIRKLLPDTGPLDLSMMIALLLMSMCEYLVVAAASNLRIVM